MRNPVQIITLLLFSFRPSFGQLPVETFVRQIADHPQVILVCIYREGPSRPKEWDREATVVQTIKGDWKVGDRIRFFVALDEEPKQPFPSELGRLKYLFLDKFSRTEPVLLQTGAACYYQSKLNAVIQQKRPK
jgi:hypothetical protein